MKPCLLFILLCLPMFKVEASTVCSVQCSLLEACQTPTKKVVKKKKKKVKKKSYKRVTKQVEIEKMCDPLTLPVMSFDTPTLPRLYMPTDLVRETPVYPTQIINTGDYTNGVLNSVGGNWLSTIPRTLVDTPERVVTPTPERVVTPTPTPLPASALLFLPAFCYMMLRRYK